MLETNQQLVLHESQLADRAAHLRFYSPQVLNQTPAEAASPGTRGECVARSACLAPIVFAGTNLYCLVNGAHCVCMCVNNLPRSLREAERPELEPAT